MLILLIQYHPGGVSSDCVVAVIQVTKYMFDTCAPNEIHSLIKGDSKHFFFFFAII